VTSVEIVPVSSSLSEAQRKFVRRVLRRKQLFLVLAVIGIVAAVGLLGIYTVLGMKGHHYEMGPRYVIMVFVLLNARQNFRQFRYAEVLEKTIGNALDEPPGA